MALHREDVIRAAVDLLDEVGLDRLTTRALTTRLGVQPGALYWHVRSKSELLSAIADEIMREVYDADAASDVGPGPENRAGDAEVDWAGQTTAFAQRLRGALRAHRDGARVVVGHLSLSGAAVQVAEQGLALMRAAGFTLAQAAYFGDTITSYVTGFVLQEQAAAPAAAAPPVEIDPARYPNLWEWQASQSASRDQAFASGLALIVDGLRAG
jgi:TetR/AcrR family tetracycline transcriptional repressor